MNISKSIHVFLMDLLSSKQIIQLSECVNQNNLNTFQVKNLAKLKSFKTCFFHFQFVNNNTTPNPVPRDLPLKFKNLLLKMI